VKSRSRKYTGAPFDFISRMLNDPVKDECPVGLLN
jgi:hypothetical protein